MTARRPPSVSRAYPPWAAVLAGSLCLLGNLLWTAAAPLDHPEVFNITRAEGGDTFSFKGNECSRKECGGRSENMTCFCSCPPKTPLFREDIQQCVGEISECGVAPFGSGSSAQKIPLVFLPLKGQIIYPSKAISFPGVRTPICAVSGAQFLTRNGFIDLRSSLDSDVPFTLFRDEGRTFLQWSGEQDMRQRMEGRLLVVQLLCRDVSTMTGSSHSTRATLGAIPTSLFGVFTPCAAFRVAGSPSRYITNITEVLFTPNARFSEDSSSPGLSLSEYIAIGISSVLLGMIYVASVFLYLHIRKKKANSETGSSEGDLPTVQQLKREMARKREIEHIDRDRRASLMSHSQNSHVENGIVKSNPLMGIERHYHDSGGLKDDFLTESDDCQTDECEQLDDGDTSDDMLHNSNQTSVIVHPLVHDQGRMIYESYYKAESFPPRDENSIERLPEENVSIVETFDFRDDKPESLPIGNTRKKLYFNPAYFEPHLLVAPPPAAIEFLTKIREVISIAKHKMEAKRFTPSLGGIPEEDTYQTAEPSSNFFHIGSQRSSVVSLKRENNRRKSYCSGCPGCERRFHQDMPTLSTDVNSGVVCHNCSSSSSNLNKQNSIRKWLESVPGTESQTKEIVSLSQYKITHDTSSPNALGMLNSLLSLPKDNKMQGWQYDFNTSKSVYAEDDANNYIIKKKITTASVRSEPATRTFNIPLPNISNPSMLHPHGYNEIVSTVTKIKDISSIGVKIPDTHLNDFNKHKNISPKQHRLPDMVSEALAIDKQKGSSPRIGNNVSRAGQICQRNKRIIDQMVEKSANSTLEKSSSVDYETDSLERSHISKGFRTPTEYADISSSQTSPTLSTALPMDEEMTMRNAVYKIGSGSRPTSRLSNKSKQHKKVDENYDAIDKHSDSGNAFENHIYNFTNPARAKTDYNLVSEVYVNNGYNFGSAPASPSESDTSTFGKRKINTELSKPVEKLGQLTIEVKDSPENYVKIHESDDFEPDTLDRKPSKLKIHFPSAILQNDSSGDIEVKENKILNNDPILNKPTIEQIKKLYDQDTAQSDGKIFTKIKYAGDQKSGNDFQDYEIIENTDVVVDNEEGRILTLETRHCKRQRESTPPCVKGSNKLNPPDIIPFEETNIYEYPKPPRLVKLPAPPLPPKNEDGRSPNINKNINGNVIVLPGRKARAPTPPSELSPGRRCPSGASVHSNHSSDYEKVTPVDNLLQQINAKSNGILPKTEFHNKLDVEHDIIEQITCGNVTCVTSKPAPKFREFQTPKAGRKSRFPPTPRKSPKDRAGSGRKSFKQGKRSSYKEDSGYLSTDSNESKPFPRKSLVVKEPKTCSGSDTDESIEDARSESGAESVETHSVFFGSYRKVGYTGNSADSGRSSDDRPASLIST